MTSIRFRAVSACFALALAAGASLSAQTPRAQNRPPTPPPVEVTPERPPLEQEETVRFHRPIFRALQNYVLGANDVVRDVKTVLGDVRIEGRVERDVVVIMGSAQLSSTAVVEGSLLVFGGAATVDSGARVGRDLVVIGGTLEAAPNFSPGGDHVVIGTPWFGNVMRDLLPWLTRGLLWGRLIVPDLGWIWVMVGVFFLLYLVLNAVFDGPVNATADTVGTRPLSAFLSGLIVLVLAVPLIAILAATVIGLLVVPFLLCGLVVAALLGKAAVARAIGRTVIRPETPEGGMIALATFTIGFALLTLAYMVPLLGFVTWALATVIGLGAATATLRGHLRRERKVDQPLRDVSDTPPPVAPVAAASVVPLSDVDPAIPPSAPAAPVVEIPPVAPATAIPPIPPPPPLFNQGLARYPRATFLDRLAAFVLDCILVAIANTLLDLNRNDGSFFFLLLCYHIAFWAWKGTTLGGIICNLRVTRTDGTDLRFVDAVVRGLSGIFSIAALGIGCFWMLQDPERQMWHDKIAGTLVVKAPREVVLA